MIKRTIHQTSPASQQKLSNPIQLFQEKNGQCVHHVSILLWKKWRWQRNLRIPLAYIEKCTGYSERQIQRAIEWLEENKVIRVLRDMYDVNIYYLTDFYRDPEVYNICMRYFTNWIIFSLALLAITPHVVLSINNDSYLKNISVSQEGYVVGTREENPEILRNHTKKKEKNTMSNNLEWSHAVSDLHKQMPLKDHGFAKLSAFPPEAIRYATLRISMAYKAQTPFQYFVKVCESFCLQNAIKPDWGQYKKMQEQMRVSNSDDYVDNQALQAIVAEETEVMKNQYQKREVRKQGDKAPDPIALAKRVKETDEYVAEREKRIASTPADRAEVVASIMAQNWTETRKSQALEFL